MLDMGESMLGYLNSHKNRPYGHSPILLALDPILSDVLL